MREVEVAASYLYVIQIPVAAAIYSNILDVGIVERDSGTATLLQYGFYSLNGILHGTGVMDALQAFRAHFTGTFASHGLLS